jgi:hypothetical protein
MAKGGKKKRGPDAKLRVVVGGKGQAQAIVSGAPRAAAVQKAAASSVAAGPPSARVAKPRVHEREEVAEAKLDVEIAPTLGLAKKPFDRRIVYGVLVIAALGIMWWFSRGPSNSQPARGAPAASTSAIAAESTSVNVIPPPPSPALPAVSAFVAPTVESAAPAPTASASAPPAPMPSASAPAATVAPSVAPAPPAPTTAPAPAATAPKPAAPKPAAPKPPQETPYE